MASCTEYGLVPWLLTKVYTSPQGIRRRKGHDYLFFRPETGNRVQINVPVNSEIPYLVDNLVDLVAIHRQLNSLGISRNSRRLLFAERRTYLIVYVLHVLVRCNRHVLIWVNFDRRPQLLVNHCYYLIFVHQFAWQKVYWNTIRVLPRSAEPAVLLYHYACQLVSQNCVWRVHEKIFLLVFR